MIPGIWELLDYVVNQVNNLGITIIWSYQNAPRVDKPYIVIDYTNDDLPNFDYNEPYPDENGFANIGSWRKAVVSLQFYCGPPSHRISSQVALMLNGNAAVDKQTQLDVAIGTRLMLQRVPALLNESQFEDRSIYQFDFYYTDNYKDNIGIIEKVIVDGSYSGSLTSVHCHEEIQIYTDVTWDDGATSWDTEWRERYTEEASLVTWDDNTVWDAHLTEWWEEI